MPESYYAGIYWGPRQESHEACADRLSAALHQLAGVDAQFRHWYKRVRSLNDMTLNEVSSEKASLDRLLARGVNRTDIGRKPIPELGFSLGLWNGGPDHGTIGLSVSCGVYSSRIPNSIVINLPDGGDEARTLINFDNVSQVLVIMARNFCPDWGTISTHRLRDDVLDLPKTMPQIGWLTYLSQAFGKVPPSSDYELVSIGDLGTLIVTTREVFSVDDPKHVRSAMAAAEAVSRLVNQAPANPPAIPGTQG